TRRCRPPNADVLESVALDVTRLAVLVERVDRTSTVGHLDAAVRTPHSAQMERSRRGCALRDHERSPQREAELIGADELSSGLDAQRVERHALAIHEHLLVQRWVVGGPDD